MAEPTQLWCECKCGYRWPVCPLPVGLGKAGRALKHATCPGCLERKEVYALPTTDKNGKVIEYALGVKRG